MSDKPSYEMLEQQIRRLERSIQGARRAELINRTLFYIASDLNSCDSLGELYVSIYKRVSDLMDISNFFYRNLSQRSKSHTIRISKGPAVGVVS